MKKIMWLKVLYMFDYIALYDEYLFRDVEVLSLLLLW